MLDAVVIGAGAAGLAATRTLVERGLAVQERVAPCGRIGNLTPGEIEAANRRIEAGFDIIDAAGAEGRDVAGAAEVLRPGSAPTSARHG